MTAENEKPEPTPVKPKDLDFEKLASEMTRTPEIVTTRPTELQPLEDKPVTKASAEKKQGEQGALAESGQPDSGTAAPGAPGAGKRAPSGALATTLLAHPDMLGDADDVPDHAGERRAATDRLLEMIVYRSAERLEHLLAHLPELPLLEQARIMTMIKEILVEMHDISITRQWTRKLQQVILERFTLLQQTKSNGLRKVAGYAAQAAKELKTDGRTTAGRNKKAATVGRFTDMPGAQG